MRWLPKLYQLFETKIEPLSRGWMAWQASEAVRNNSIEEKAILFLVRSPKKGQEAS